MIKLHFEKLSRFDRTEEPCTAAIPFPQGKLFDTSAVAIKDGDRRLPSLCKITAVWPDKSIKWLLVNFLADLPGNKAKDIFCVLDEGGNKIFNSGLKVSNTNGRVKVETGVLDLELNAFGEKGIFKRLQYGANSYEGNQIAGPVLTDNKGQEWIAEVGEKGWEVVEGGPVRVILQTKGKHTNSGESSWLDYVLRIYAFAGKPWIRLDYQIINRENGKEQVLKGIEIQFHSNAAEGEVNTALATSNYESYIRYGKLEDKLYHTIDAQQLVYEANEHIPETFYGTFWADWNDKNKGGLCATIYQAHQNYPKAMEVDKSGIRIKILPEENGNLKLLQGMAKTHRVFLHFHDAEEDIKNLNVRSLQFQMPDRPVIDSRVYEEAKVFEEVFVENKIDTVERAIISKADGRGKAYGILHWGDAPDPGYTQQGRGNGEPVWTNNEYDFPHAAMLQYARSGERRMLDYVLVAAEHWMDVDVCHHSEDPLRYQAQIIHSAFHVTGDVEASHEWVEGLLDYYHQTGEVSAYETAMGIGENVLRQLSQPRYQQKGEINARETGWALRTLVALYKETNDEKWLEPSEWIVGHFEAWKEEYGQWLAPYTDHTAIRVPFMIAVAVGSLMRYYRIRPQEKVKKMIIDAVEDLIENCKLENGVFYYKELPSLRRLGTNTIVLEALTYAYELTGNAEYLKEGLVTFNNEITNTSGHWGGSKQIVKDAVIMQGPGPKGFAQSFYPIVCFYRAASKAGILNSVK